MHSASSALQTDTKRPRTVCTAALGVRWIQCEPLWHLPGAARAAVTAKPLQREAESSVGPHRTDTSKGLRRSATWAPGAAAQRSAGAASQVPRHATLRRGASGAIVVDHPGLHGQSHPSQGTARRLAFAPRGVGTPTAVRASTDRLGHGTPAKQPRQRPQSATARRQDTDGRTRPPAGATRRRSLSGGPVPVPADPVAVAHRCVCPRRDAAATPPTFAVSLDAAHMHARREALVRSWAVAGHDGPATFNTTGLSGTWDPESYVQERNK